MNDLPPPPAPQQSRRLISLLVPFIILGFVTSFVSGFLFSSFTNPPPDSPSPTPEPPTSITPQITPDIFIPGKSYFNDTLIALAKDGSFAIAATAARQQTNTGFNQSTRISLFAGGNWTRYINEGQSINSSGITPNHLVTNWNIAIDPSRVLKQSVDLTLKLDNSNLSVSTGEIENEIGVRSLPGYTKFMSQGESKVLLNNQYIPVNILYTRIYSLNSSEIQFLNTPLDAKTDWLAFWDNNGNFYHIDSTTVGQSTPIYQSHHIGVLVTPTGAVSKTFDLEVVRDTDTNPTTYVVSLGRPINQGITFSRRNLNNKATTSSQNWIMGTVAGTVTSPSGIISGVGLMEYVSY